MEWKEFGEVGAAAALAGLLFVSVSVNQQRTLALDRSADRGAEALILLFLALTAASSPRIPGQSSRLLGTDATRVGLVAALAMLRSKRSYLRDLEPSYLRQGMGMVWLNRSAVAGTVTGGLMLVQRGDTAGVYVVALVTLVIFYAASANAWVLLIEIGRWPHLPANRRGCCERSIRGTLIPLGAGRSSPSPRCPDRAPGREAPRPRSDLRVGGE